MTPPNIADLRYLFFGGGTDAEYALLLSASEDGITAVDLLGLVAGSTAVTANRQTASYIIALDDAGKVVEMNVASGNTLTVPPNVDVAFPVGTVLEILQYGAGQTTLTPGAAVTIRSPGGKLKIAAQYGGATLRKIATNEWAAEGNLTT